MNEVRISGRLTRDPEMRITTNSVVANFSIAHSYKQKSGDQKVNFFDIVAWRDIADKIVADFKKGEYIEITGYLEQQTWKNNEGEKRSKVVVVATEAAPGKWNDVETGKVTQVSPPTNKQDEDIPF